MDSKQKLDTFFNKNYSKLLKMSRNILKNSTYKDILNDAIIIIYTMDEVKVSKLLDDNVLEYYMFGIITNIKNEGLRHKNNNFYDVMIEDLINIPENEENIEERTIRELREDTIYQDCMFILSDRRNWFANRIFLDMVNEVYTSFRDFSTKTGIAHATLWSSYDKTRKKLRNKYEK